MILSENKDCEPNVGNVNQDDSSGPYLTYYPTLLETYPNWSSMSEEEQRLAAAAHAAATEAIQRQAAEMIDRYNNQVRNGPNGYEPQTINIPLNPNLPPASDNLNRPYQPSRINSLEPQVNNTSKFLNVPNLPNFPNVSNFTNVPTFPNLPNFPSISNPTNTSNVPNNTNFTNLYNNPYAPNVTNVASDTNGTSIPNVGNFNSTLPPVNTNNTQFVTEPSVPAPQPIPPANVNNETQNIPFPSSMPDMPKLFECKR